MEVQLHIMSNQSYFLSIIQGNPAVHWQWQKYGAFYSRCNTAAAAAAVEQNEEQMPPLHSSVSPCCREINRPLFMMQQHSA